jgi:hypothetical protein
MVRPILPDELSLEKVQHYSELVRCTAQAMAYCLTSLGPTEAKLNLVNITIEHLKVLGSLEQEIERNILSITDRIGPVSGAVYLLPPPAAFSVNIGLFGGS